LNPPVWFLAVIILLAAARLLFPGLNIIVFPYNLIGLPICAIGIYLIAAAMKLFSRHNTAHNFDASAKVIDEGVFGLTRNPMYAGKVLFLVGLTVLAGNLIGFAGPLIFFLLMHFVFIPFEEKKLEDELGASYLEYKTKVRRWL